MQGPVELCPHKTTLSPEAGWGACPGVSAQSMWMGAWWHVPPDSIHVQGQAGGVDRAADDSLDHSISPSLDAQRSSWRECTW